MKKALILFLSIIMVFSISACTASSQVIEKQISNDDLYDKILGSWIGQAAGVVWGASTEFVYGGKTIPENEVPSIDSLDMNGMFTQDDLYVEIPFIQAMLENGVNCDIKYLADAFKNTEFPLWHANLAARDNLIKDIEAPLSGNPLYNQHSEDIDWQIEADFVGHLYPGLINTAANKAFEIGHIMNYGDGVYGGVFVTAMHSAAFFAKDINEIINAGIQAIPEGTTFRQIMDDVKKCFDEGKTWEECWQFIETKWGKTDRCISLAESELNIDAKMNSAYILIGLLYGKGNFDDSMRISMQCGQDSDCNPSSVGAILGNFYGYKALDEKWKKVDTQSGKFQYTEYTLDDCVQGNITLLKQVLTEKGFTEKDGIWTISVDTAIVPVKFEQWGDDASVGIASAVENGVASLNASIVSVNEIKAYEWDMGDGATYDIKEVYHVYKTKGEYTVKCKITDSSDKVYTAEKLLSIDKVLSDYDKADAGTVRNIASISAPLCTVKLPQGVGAKSLGVLSDGIKSGGSTAQYDTFNFATSPYEQYFAYLFPVDFMVSSVVFTEGMHFDNGGWFRDGDLRLEAYINGKWEKVDAAVSPEYPAADNISAFGQSFQNYTFTINNASVADNANNIKCSGIRVIGTGGGAASFISAAELEVTAVEAE
ncbi:MAG: putative rane protein [Clostridia bacterium]|nr:putative rane protein [Clostridia bacterium]